MDLAFDMILRGVLLPAGLSGLLLGVALLATRLAGRPAAEPAGWPAAVVELAAAAGVASAVFAAYVALVEAPPWPPRQAVHWVVWSALGGASLAAVDIVLRRLPLPNKALALVRVLLPAVAGAVLAPRLLAPLVTHAWDAAEARRALWLAGGGVVVLWAGLDGLAARVGPRAWAASATALAGGAAVSIVLGHTAVLAQVTGALSAGLGAMFVVTLLPVARGVEPRAAALPVAVVLGAAVTSAHHYADLSGSSWAILHAAPAVAVLGTLVASRERWPRLAAITPVVLLVVATALAAASAERGEVGPAPGSVEEELEYGYEVLEGEGGVSPAPDSAPNPYADPALLNWKPAEAP